MRKIIPPPAKNKYSQLITNRQDQFRVLNLKIISCTLDQLATNCRFLTKEIFKMMNLKQ
ncbi:MAG: hypothetical protein V4539_25760 [Bacteroidota bacterium]